MGGAGQAMADGNKQNCTSHKPCDLNTLHIRTQTPWGVTEKRFSASFAPQPAENHTFLNIGD